MGSKETGVFLLPEVKKLAPILGKAFKRVSSDKTVRFELKSKSGITSGDIFSFRNFLNWRFDSIQGELFFQKNNVREWNIFAWELIPKNSQKYFKTRIDKRINKNWIVAKLKLPVQTQKDTGSPMPVDGSQNQPVNINPLLEQKLEHLKYLYEKQLINEDEYKNQQKKIFNELF